VTLSASSADSPLIEVTVDRVGYSDRIRAAGELVHLQQFSSDKLPRTCRVLVNMTDPVCVRVSSRYWPHSKRWEISSLTEGADQISVNRECCRSIYASIYHRVPAAWRKQAFVSSSPVAKTVRPVGYRMSSRSSILLRFRMAQY
jgi:hypothetical protein